MDNQETFVDYVLKFGAKNKNVLDSKVYDNKYGFKHYRVPYNYYGTIAEYIIDPFTVYYLNRRENGQYILTCHLSGAWTDKIIAGSLGQCYRELLKHI